MRRTSNFRQSVPAANERFLFNRRTILKRGLAASVAASFTGQLGPSSADAAPPIKPLGVKRNLPAGVTLLHPRHRVPLSFIIDDSTCLVNMGHFCMPQFASAWPQREIYRQPWQKWPREIPDSFVAAFAQWCGEHGVKGKYSIVPFPACVGWLDRELPGWSRTDLQNSLRVVRTDLLSNWDIHPEMITHTRVIDLKTGRPLDNPGSATMENSYPQTDISVDHLASYLAYALRILRNCDLPCEGITTPGGFGNRVKHKLPVAVAQSVSDVYSVSLSHYFKYVIGDDQSTLPRLEWAGDLANAPAEISTENLDLSQLTVNVPAGTGDWFGSWEGINVPRPDLYCNQDASAGRMVDLILRNEPAVMLCHWPGMYCNGSLVGFKAFQRVVESLHSRFSASTIWMKPSEMARYYATRELVTMECLPEGTVQIDSPMECAEFTFSLPAEFVRGRPQREGAFRGDVRKVGQCASLQAETFTVQDGRAFFCLNLQVGRNRLRLR